MKFLKSIKSEWIFIALFVLIAVLDGNKIVRAILDGHSLMSLKVLLPLSKTIMLSAVFLTMSKKWQPNLAAVLLIVCGGIIYVPQTLRNPDLISGLLTLMYIYFLIIALSKMYIDNFRPFILVLNFLNPKNSKVLYKRALSDLNSGLYKSSLKLGKKLMETDCPSHLSAYIVGNSKVYLGDYKAAIETLSSIKEKDINKSGWLYTQYGMALSFYNLGENNRASDLFELYLNEYPDNYYALFNHALCKSALDKDDEAIELYSRILEKHPKDSDVLYNRGSAYYRLDQRDKALADWNKALEVPEICVKAYVTVGLYHFEDDDIETAVSYYEKAYMYQPDLVEYFPDEIKERLSIEKA